MALFHLRLVATTALTLAGRAGADAERFNGVCYASWATAGADSYDSTSSDASIAKAALSGINTLAVVQTWYMSTQNDTTIAASPSKSNTEAGLRRAIATARARGLKVALKPHVDFTDDDAHWRGEIGPAFSPTDWVAWFASYSAYMLSMAALAESERVELFVVGTELITTEAQEDMWRALIARIRTIAPTAKLVYGANYSPGPENVRFWDALDYVGVDAYYPLATAAAPSVEELVLAWQTSPVSGRHILSELKNLSTRVGKPLMFAELGYTSTDKCAMGNHAGGARDLQAQADAYTAFFEAVYDQPWFAGVFFWDWETNPRGGGRCDGGATSFTPAGKPAENVMRSKFGGTDQLRSGSATATDPVPVYADGKLVSGWQDYSYNGKTDLNSGVNPFPGHNFSAFGTYTDWGAMAFFSGHGVMVSRAAANPANPTGLVELCFALRATNSSGDETQVALYGSADESHPFSALFISHYTANCSLSKDSWTRQVCVPIVDLLPPLEPPSPPSPPGPSCSDTPPSGNTYTCAQQKAWGKCDTKANPWMAGYCCKTCFDCAPGCGKSAPMPAPGGGDGDRYKIVRVEFKANFATGVGAFGLDQVRFQ